MILNNANRAGFTMWQLIGVILIVATVIGLVVPVIQKMRDKQAREDSVNNLKQIGLAFHEFHDVHKRLPYNGTSRPYFVNGVPHGGPAIGGDFTTGSWAFQLLPYLDHKAIFNRADRGLPAPVFLCPGRGRPALCNGAGAAGAWTDYFLNPFLNNDDGAFDVAELKRTMVCITDGTSNTIFVGHGQIRPEDYGKAHSTPGFTDVIFIGGSAANTRVNQKVVLAQDSAESASGNWGGPWSNGALMGMGDATVRLFPYTMEGGTVGGGVSQRWFFGSFLTPIGSESGSLPEA